MDCSGMPPPIPIAITKAWLSKKASSPLPPHQETPKWTPDVQLTTLHPPQRSLSAPQYKQYHLYQKLLQQIHLEMQYTPTTFYQLQYVPHSTHPQGIAGIPAAVLTLELLLKEFLISDRYAHSLPDRKVPATDLAHALRQESPALWHLPLKELYEKTDAQIKLRGQTARLNSPHHPNKNANFSNPLDKDTQKALSALPSNIPTQHKASPIIKPTQPNMGNYKGNPKNYDPNFRHPNSPQK